MVQRPPHGLWGGLWEFPRAVCEPGEQPEDCATRAARDLTGIDVIIKGKLATVKHQVTHHAITLHGYETTRRNGKPTTLSPNLAWQTIGQLTNLPVSAPQKQLVEALLDRS